MLKFQARYRPNTPASRAAAERNGVTATEFALIAPVVFFITFACFEFARLNMIRNSAENAVYEGARVGIVPGASAEDCKATASAVVNHVLAFGETVTVEPSVITPDTETVTVTIEIPFDENSWVLPVFFPNQTITASRTLRRDLIETVTVP